MILEAAWHDFQEACLQGSLSQETLRMKEAYYAGCASVLVAINNDHPITALIHECTEFSQETEHNQHKH